MTTTTKQRVSEEQRRRVLDLRRRLSLREVATATGLPLGTVKTLVSRSGAFRDNREHRAFFTLPPFRPSAGTDLNTRTAPPQRAITGDKEVDALLWLRECIETGDEVLIGLALEASKRIATPHRELDQRFREWEARPYRLGLKPGIPPFRFHGLHELERLAKESLALAKDRAEAAGRFGNVNADTDQEHWCCVVLAGLEPNDLGLYDDAKVAERFKAHPERLPHTLADCLHELDYWRDLWRLRRASPEAPGAYAYQGPGEASARRFFVEGLLAEIRPRNRDEAKAVLRYATAHKLFEGGAGDAILENLIG
ncbi:hypothetical protein [Azotobacter beijerinckii]|uniref:Uncharacterized protein n=1 Tax=Azotobacter beijerinckii TaxID=170623 RepID=A0A1I1A1F6_9GAMM|nr:hypothetical protein [Azotobacter beijerinckii]SFB31775.1 hypothetical protein SAMN04244571_02229 [Azotobacter beijerinckii]